MHTPGPWKKKVSKWHVAIQDVDGIEIWVAPAAAFMPDGSADIIDEVLANARLTEAAPDLLAACEQARKAIQSLPEDALGYEYEQTGPDDYDGWPLRDELLDQLKKAIARARGTNLPVL